MSKSTKNKVALITGISGQDGSFLAEFLIKKIIGSMALFAELRLSILQGLIIYTTGLMTKNKNRI